MSSLGGGFQGISAKQTLTNYKDSEQTSARDIVRRSWNTAFATGTVNNYKRRVTPFRAVNNSGDFLLRKNYDSNGANPDSTGIPSALLRLCPIGYSTSIASVDVPSLK